MKKYPNLKNTILKTLRRKGNHELLRKELTTLLNIPRSTLYDYLIRLELEGEIETYHPMQSRNGRPNTKWRIK